MHRDPTILDEMSVHAEMRRLIRGIATAVRTTPERLCAPPTAGPHGGAFTKYRWLAIAVCRQTDGVDLEEVADWFRIVDARNVRQYVYEFNKAFERHPGFCEEVVRICRDLGVPVPGHADEAWLWQRIDEVWEGVAVWADVPAEILQLPLRDRKHTRWRQLARDICLRIPAVTQQMVRVLPQTGFTVRQDLPGLLERYSEMREADRVVSAQFHVPHRRESALPD